VRLKKIK